MQVLRRRIVHLLVACLALAWAHDVVADQAATPIDFATIALRDSPNDHLVCPPDYCRAAGSHQPAPRIEVPVAELRARLERLLAGEPRVTVVSDTPDQLVVEQKSGVFGFVDVIDIRLIPLGEGASTLAIYSRSNTGYYDFGVNESRLTDWLAALQAGG